MQEVENELHDLKVMTSKIKRKEPKAEPAVAKKTKEREPEKEVAPPTSQAQQGIDELPISGNAAKTFEQLLDEKLQAEQQQRTAAAPAEAKRPFLRKNTGSVTTKSRKQLHSAKKEVSHEQEASNNEFDYSVDKTGKSIDKKAGGVA